MKKLIYNKVDKAMISQLKRVVYYGKIYVVTSAADAENVVDYLLSQPLRERQELPLLPAAGLYAHRLFPLPPEHDRTLSGCGTTVERHESDEGGAGVE